MYQYMFSFSWWTSFSSCSGKYNYFTENQIITLISHVKLQALQIAPKKIALSLLHTCAKTHRLRNLLWSINQLFSDLKLWVWKILHWRNQTSSNIHLLSEKEDDFFFLHVTNPLKDNNRNITYQIKMRLSDRRGSMFVSFINQSL